MNPTAKLLIFTFILHLIGTTVAVQSCYYCTPTDKGCDDPVKNERQAMPCYKAVADDNLPHGRLLKQMRLKSLNPDDIEYMCATIQISNSNATLSGLYRTCLVKSQKVDDCELLKAEFKNQNFGNPLTCLKCNEELCNNQTKSDIGSSSTAIKSSVLFYTFVSFLVIYAYKY